jgi:hypothetical protein
VVQAAELFADGRISEKEMTEARDAVLPAFVRLHGAEEEASAAAISAAGIPAPKMPFFEQLLDAFYDPWWEDEFDKGDAHAPAVVTARHAAWASAYTQARRPLSGSPDELAARRKEVGFLRELFGNPFHPVALAPAVLAWNDATVVRLAQAAYDERHMPEGTLENGRLAVLADALEEAGCRDADILGHCRSGGEHVRGCWVIDLLLGKS